MEYAFESVNVCIEMMSEKGRIYQGESVPWCSLLSCFSLSVHICFIVSPQEESIMGGVSSEVKGFLEPTIGISGEHPV